MSTSNYHHGDLANSLKIAALALIQKTGVAHFSLRALAKDCDVSATAVYRHYKNKEHLLAALAEDGLKALQKAMSATRGTKRLQLMGLAYIKFALKNPLYFRLIFDLSIDKTKLPALMKQYAQTCEVVKSEVKKCVEEGSMVGDIDTLTQTAWATAHGTALLLLERQFSTEKKDDLKIATDILGVVGRGLGRVD